MKNYYEVLGVSQSASATEIRNAYRKLVQHLHPDINPDPSALERIQEINEAYDILGDEAKRRQYDYQRENPFSAPDPEPQPKHRDPYYNKNRTRPRTESSSYTPRELMTMYLKYIRWICAGCFAFAFVLGLDFFVPRSEQVEDIESAYRVNNLSRYGRQTYSHDVMVMASGKEVSLYEHAITVFEGEHSARLSYTPVFRHVMSVAVVSTGEEVRTDQAYTTLWFVPAMLFICSGLGLFLKGVEMPFNFGIISVVLFFITLYLY